MHSKPKGRTLHAVITVNSYLAQITRNLQTEDLH